MSLQEHGPTPWWAGYLLTSPLRRLVHDPRRILSPFVKPGMTVLEPGPGRGFFTLEIARLVGPQGKVVAPELDPRQLAGLTRRAARAGLSAIVEPRQATRQSLGVADLENSIDFALSFAVAHESCNARAFFDEIARTLKPQAQLLLVEPDGHVPPRRFEAIVQAATQSGLAQRPAPDSDGDQTALFQKA